MADLFSGGQLIDTRKILAPTGYRTAESGQDEVHAYSRHGNNTAYEEIYVVTEGKTFYVTDIVIGASTGTVNSLFFAVGAAASEVDFMVFPIGAQERIHFSFQVQLRFTTGTRLSWKPVVGVTWEDVTFIGFEE